MTFPILGAVKLLTAALALHMDPRGTGLYGPSSKGAGAAPAALEQALTHLRSPFGVDREHPWVLLPFPNPLLSTPSTACLPTRLCWASSPQGSQAPLPLLSCPVTPTADSSDFPHGMSGYTAGGQEFPQRQHVPAAELLGKYTDPVSTRDHTWQGAEMESSSLLTPVTTLEKENCL